MFLHVFLQYDFISWIRDRKLNIASIVNLISAMKEGVVSSICITADIFILICYFLGIVLIVVLKKRGKSKIQHLLWLNISSYAVLLNVIDAVSEVLYQRGIYLPTSINLTSVMLFTSQLGLAYYMVLAMIYINIDRLLLILLNMRYKIYVTKKRVSFVIFITWGACILTFLGMSFTNESKNIQIFIDRRYRAIFNRYIALSLDGVYVLSAVVIYSIIFHNCIVSERRVRNGEIVPSFKDIYRSFRRSRFYFAFLLILSYTLFIAVPNLVLMLVKPHPILMFMYRLSLRMSWASDALIFMFMNRDTRELLLEKIRRNEGRVKDSRTVVVISSTV